MANGHLIGEPAIVMSEVEWNRYLIELEGQPPGERLAVISGRELAFLETP